MADEYPNKIYHISKGQLDTLVELAGKDVVKEVFISGRFTEVSATTDLTVTKDQIERFVSRAGDEAVVKALIQNGSKPTDFN